MYVAVKGGEKAIEKAHKLLAEERRGDRGVPEFTLAQIQNQMGLLVERVMNEGSLYDERLASLALKQSQGDVAEAVFLLRAYRTTLPRLGFSIPVDSSRMRLKRRISATFKDLPGGQILGPTYDYTHRLLDFSLEKGFGRKSKDQENELKAHEGKEDEDFYPRVTELLAADGFLEIEEPCGSLPEDLTREPLKTPCSRALRLQNLARADEGFLLAMAYSAQRGFGISDHPFAGEIRMGWVEIEVALDEVEFSVVIGEICVTECVMITPAAVGEKAGGDPFPMLTLGYGLTFGRCERKAMAMAIVDRTLKSRELGERVAYPAQDEAFVLMHSDSLEASGFVQHLKLPHYVDFQAEIVMMRELRESAKKEGRCYGKGP